MSLLRLFKPRTVKKHTIRGTLAYRATRKKHKSTKPTTGLVMRDDPFPLLFSTRSILPTQLLAEQSRPRFTKWVASVRPVGNSIKKPTRSNLFSLPQLNAISIEGRSVANVRWNEAGLICARRKEREEILHAIKKTGKTGQRPKRFTPQSKIKCERIY